MIQKKENKINKSGKLNKSKSPKLTKNYEYNQYTKKCLNCGNYFINKCYKCTENKNKGTFSQIRDESEMEQVKFVYNRTNRTVKSDKKIKTKKDIVKEWKCKYCDKKNKSKNQFCVNCLMNK